MKKKNQSAAARGAGQAGAGPKPLEQRGDDAVRGPQSDHSQSKMTTQISKKRKFVADGVFYAVSMASLRPALRDAQPPRTAPFSFPRSSTPNPVLGW